MVPTTRYKVSLRVSHPIVRADEIVARVGFQPRVVQSVGDRRTTPKGTPLEGTHRQTYVLFDLEEFEGVIGLEQMIKIATKDLVANAGPYVSDLAETGGKVTFSVGVFCDENAGFEIDAGLIRSLAAANIGLIFFIYPQDESSEAVDEAPEAATR